MAPPKFEKGQVLYWVKTLRHAPETGPVTILAVGTKYIALEQFRCRIRKDNLEADGGGFLSPGRCYLSPEDYEATEGLRRNWNEFSQRVSATNRAPEGVTQETIDQAYPLLNISPRS